MRNKRQIFVTFIALYARLDIYIDSCENMIKIQPRAIFFICERKWIGRECASLA